MTTPTPMRSPLRLGKLALLLGTAALTPVAAYAQDAEGDVQEEPTSTLDAINEILVTGTKTKDAENVQDVPLAVTAFNAGTLEAYKIRDISGLSFQAPTVSLDQVGTSRGTANFTVRGLGINSSIPSIDPTVGVFVDGVYLGINGGVVFDLFDLDSVEILRGPQGVLFGRNVTGGAVVINTGNPTEDFRGKFRAAVDGPALDSGRGGANYPVSGTITLWNEETALLQLNGGETVRANGPIGSTANFPVVTPFQFTTTVPYGSTYTVTVPEPPGFEFNEPQTCTITNGSGTMPAGSVTNVVITCDYGNVG